MQNVKAIDQLKVLDNEVKLKILALLADTGAKSITEISRLLNLNFSTAHKYLEQLENAGFVKSRQETENRLKRMFYIQDFCVHIDPRNISQILSGGKIQHGDEAYGNFSIITNDGQLEKFNKFKFAKPYLDAGIPKSTIEIVFDTIKEQIYDGITLIELESMFVNALKKRIELVQSVIYKIHNSKLHERTFSNVLALRFPEAIKMHEQGSIFIKSLGKPKLLNFVHDIRGISLHGVNKAPKNLDELFKQIVYVVSVIDEQLCRKHALPSLNYLIAPFVKKIDRATLDKFLTALNKYNLDINLDFGEPAFTRNIPTKYFGSEEYYSNYSELANHLAEEIIDVFDAKKFSNLHIIAKLHNTKYRAKRKAGITVTDVTDDANYIRDTKITADWKGWLMCSRVGEAQKISINLPQIIWNTRDFDESKNQISELLSKVINIHINNAEALLGRLLSSNIIFSSEIRERWNYVHINELAYSIALHGLNCVNKETQIKLVRHIAEFVNKVKHEKNLRLILKLETSPMIISRFNKINSRENESRYLPEFAKLLDGGYAEK